jgi:hypothetical protein
VFSHAIVTVPYRPLQQQHHLHHLLALRREFGAKNHNSANTEMKSADTTAQLTQALNELSYHEQEQAVEDLHGVPSTINKTPELIEKALSDMEQYLQQTILQNNTNNYYNKPSLSSSSSSSLSAYALAQT